MRDNLTGMRLPFWLVWFWLGVVCPGLRGLGRGCRLYVFLPPAFLPVDWGADKGLGVECIGDVWVGVLWD